VTPLLFPARYAHSFIAGVEFSSVPAAPPAELPKTVLGATVLDATSRAAASNILWSKKHVRTFLRVASLLFAGMILGAMLAFVWFFAQAKNRRSANSAKVSAFLTECEFQRPPVNLV
jgi:hypothetical protein